MIDSVSSNSTDPIDVFRMLVNLTDKILSRIAFGKTFQSRDQSSDGSRLQEILYDTMEALNGFSASDFLPSVGWIIDRITGVHGRIEKCFHDFDEYFQDIIDIHHNPERQKSKHEDLIDVLLKVEKDGRSTIH
ncbi:cytochrome P450 71B26-like [Papaver somniferum]|uniref:cytochrome P450 71B26-like n=1 Tax=Papaver somniferum TaxID=3469 RepID=UPI000E6FE79B|nr:cytochrome P450 71B26-like [Papaver somniferum]